MKCVFVSNYYNHHQAPFSEAMFRLLKGEYYFIECEPMEEERKNMGWSVLEFPSFVKHLFENDTVKAECQKMINEADCVIIGSAPDTLIQKRLKQGKIILRYSERIFKKACKKYELPIRKIKYYWKWGRFSNFYLLCASAYTSADYAKVGTFLEKAYKWGYFPEVKLFNDIDLLMSKKNNVSILWVGRLIEWKHPDVSILVAKGLKEMGYKFDLNIIGNGPLEKELKQQIINENLTDCVTILGVMSPEAVREHMEKSAIFLFTSDFNEGWGAVLNESMNSGCAVVASHAIGSVPFLINDGENGLIYENANQEDLFKKVKFLLDNVDEQKRLGKNAYYTLTKRWNAECAAARLVKLIEEIQNKGKCDLYEEGPCSKAEIIENGWFENR